MAGRRHGSKGQVKMDPAGGSTAVVVADLNAWTGNFARDTVDVTAFQDATKQYVVGLPDAKGTVAGWWNSTSSPALFQVAFGDTPVTLELYPSTLDVTDFFSGLAYLDAAINVSATGAVSISGNWVGAGDWTLAP
jgi:hypothetical protein